MPACQPRRYMMSARVKNPGMGTSQRTTQVESARFKLSKQERRCSLSHLVVRFLSGPVDQPTARAPPDWHSLSIARACREQKPTDAVTLCAPAPRLHAYLSADLYCHSSSTQVEQNVVLRASPT